SGESNIRMWIIENDWLEAIVALPTDMFYNTGISTYIWILTNLKHKERRKKIQIIYGADFFVMMRKSLGSKRKELSAENIAEISRLYGENEQNEYSKIFDNDEFGYWTITVDRPLRLNFQVSEDRRAKLHDINHDDRRRNLFFSVEEFEKLASALSEFDPDEVHKDRAKFLPNLKHVMSAKGFRPSTRQLKAILQCLGERDEEAEICRDKDGQPEPDSELRDTENVPLKDDIQAYFEREVLPHIPDAWIDHDKTKKGYEIPFNRHFYNYVPPRSLDEIDADLKEVTADILKLLQEVAA
ncbi:MAG: N-6 DNA methylase, partial [Pyrinomonadaceae bacterium]